MLFQYIYKPILNFIYEKVTYRIGDRVRQEVISACFFIICLCQFLTLYGWSIGLGVRHEDRNIIIGALIAVVILMSVDRKLEILKNWNLKVYIPFVLTGLLLMVAGFDHYIGQSYTVFPLFMLFECICLYYVWGNKEEKDYFKLFDAMARGGIGLLVILVLVCVVKYPYLDVMDAYTIRNINPNGFVKIVAPGMAAAMYLLVRNIDSTWRMIFYGILTGASVYIVLESGAIFATLIIIISLVCLIIFFTRELKISERHNKLRFAIIAAVTVVLAFGLIGVVLKHVTVLNYEAPVATEEVESSDDSDGNEEPKDWEHIPGSMPYVKAQGLNVIGDNEVLLKLDTLSNGRIVIWAAYCSHLSLKGTDAKMFSHGAHNQFIQFAYSAGIVTGIAWLLCAIIVALQLLYRCIIKKKRYLYYSVFTYIVFILIAMLESGYMPLERNCLFLYFMTIGPMMFKMKSDIEEN